MENKVWGYQELKNTHKISNDVVRDVKNLEDKSNEKGI